MNKQHHYRISVKWTGNKGSGTLGYTAYDRDHTIIAEGKPEIPGSSDPSYRGDKTRYNPEELLLAAISSCHMLWYLHLCAVSGVVVTGYEDHATGVMVETPGSGGKFSEVTLKPVVHIADESMTDIAIELHRKAHELCYIANSLNFPVRHEPGCMVSKNTP